MKKRLFIAARLPAAIQHELGTAAGELRKTLHGAPINWVEQHLYHLTIHYLGDVEESMIASVGHTIDRVLENLKKPECTITGEVGAFMDAGTPRVLWVPMTDTTDSLKQAHARLAAALPVVGITPPARDLHMHITIGRVREHAGAITLSPLPMTTQSFAPESLELMESVLRPGGPLYTVISSHHFHGN